MPNFNIHSSADLHGGQIINVKLEMLTADPGTPEDGRIWLRTDISEIRVRLDATTHAIPLPLTGGGGPVTGTTSATFGLDTDNGTAYIILENDDGQLLILDDGSNPAAVTMGNLTAGDIIAGVLSLTGDINSTGGFYGGEIEGTDITASNDLHVQGNAQIDGNLIVDGEMYTRHATEVNLGDSNILLNAEITGDEGNADGGMTVKRYAADDTTRRDALMLHVESVNRWQMTYGATTAAPFTRTVVGRYTQDIGDASATSFTIAASVHGLGANRVHVSVFNKSDDVQEYPIIKVSSAGLVTIDFGTTVIASNSYEVLITG